MTTVRIVAATHTGSVRTRNEDCYGATSLAASRTDGEVVSVEVSKLPCCAVVADGLGGHPAGDIASAVAVESVLAEESKTASDLVAAVHRANQAVVDAMAQHENSVGMGSTVAAVLANGSELTVVNVGDSTVFELENDRLVQLSTDDSPVGVSILPGLPAATVTQSLGGSPQLAAIDPHVYQDAFAPPRRLLLSTDGLTNFVPRHELTNALRQNDAVQVVDRLLALAIEAGAPDNVTCVLMDLR